VQQARAFHASGGADSSDTEQETASFALVRALPIPRLPPSRRALSATRTAHNEDRLR